MGCISDSWPKIRLGREVKSSRGLDVFSTSMEDCTRGSLRKTLRTGKDMSCILTLPIITETLKQGTKKGREFLFGTMGKCTGDNGLRAKSMAREHGRAEKILNNLILGNGSMANLMDLEF